MHRASAICALETALELDAIWTCPGRRGNLGQGRLELISHTVPVRFSFTLHQVEGNENLCSRSILAWVGRLWAILLEMAARPTEDAVQATPSTPGFVAGPNGESGWQTKDTVRDMSRTVWESPCSCPATIRKHDRIGVCARESSR